MNGAVMSKSQCPAADLENIPSASWFSRGSLSNVLKHIVKVEIEVGAWQLGLCPTGK